MIQVITKPTHYLYILLFNITYRRAIRAHVEKHANMQYRCIKSNKGERSERKNVNEEIHK